MSFVLKVFKMMLVIFSCSYFFAMIFKIGLDIQNDIYNWDRYAVQGQEQDEHFTQFYQLTELENVETDSDMKYQIIIMYFSFTTLSTVGFGDYNPRSNFERIFISIGLLFGVAIFSYLTGEFMQIVQKFTNYNDDGDEDDRLATFFGVMAEFNSKELFNIQLKRDIEDYFAYRWDQDKYKCINPEGNENYLMQVPDNVHDTLLKEFLFENFLTAYYDTFRLPRNGHYKHMFYTWEQEQYRLLMTNIL